MRARGGAPIGTRFEDHLRHERNGVNVVDTRVSGTKAHLPTNGTPEDPLALALTTSHQNLPWPGQRYPQHQKVNAFALILELKPTIFFLCKVPCTFIHVYGSLLSTHGNGDGDIRLLLKLDFSFFKMSFSFWKRNQLSYPPQTMRYRRLVSVASPRRLTRLFFRFFFSHDI